MGSYLSVLLNDNLNDNDDIMKQNCEDSLQARANSFLRKFAACPFEVKLFAPVSSVLISGINLAAHMLCSRSEWHIIVCFAALSPL